MKPADVFRLLPVIFFVSVIFLLVRVHQYSLPLSRFTYMAESDDTVLFDCFSHVKSVAVMAVSIVAAVLLSVYLLSKKRRIRRTYLYIPMAMYAFFILLSYFMSEWKDFSLFGTYDRFEGTIVHLCYLFMMFYTVNAVDNERQLKLIIDTLFAGVTIACLIGLSQFLGHDFFSQGIGKSILLGGLDADVTFNFGGGKIYQTVYNINYVAFYMCLVFPILICRIADTAGGLSAHKAAGLSQKEKKQRFAYLIWLCILLLLMVINIAGADSTGSLPGLAVGSAAAVIIRLPEKTRRICAAVFAAAVLTAVILAGAGVFGDRYSVFVSDSSDRPDIEYIRTNEDTVEMCINGNRLFVTYDPKDGGFSLTDEEGFPLHVWTLPEDDNRYEFGREGFNGVVSFTPVSSDGRAFAILGTKDEEWVFEFTDDGAVYINEIGIPERLDTCEHAGIFNNYRFGSGRGYLWDTSLPLIKKHIFAGTGADTFMFVFPQYDYATRYSHELEINCVYDKPHNMYLQMTVCFGVCGMLSFVSIFLFIGVFCVKKAEKKEDDNTRILSLSVYAGIVAFLIAALANDSSVQVMPMFYGLAGCAISLKITG